MAGPTAASDALTAKKITLFVRKMIGVRLLLLNAIYSFVCGFHCVGVNWGARGLSVNR